MIKRLVLGFGCLVVLLLAAGLWQSRGRMAARELERFETLPAFSMTGVTAKTQKPLSGDDLKGRPWVADFIFAHCEGPSPLLSQKMAQLQKRLPADVRLVSFSVDPDRDTPDVLTEYAKSYGADPDRWVFLTGAKDVLYKLVYEGFRLSVAEDRNAPSASRMIHSTQLVLVDSEGVVRGYYNGLDEDALDRVERAVAQLMRQEPSATGSSSKAI